MAMMKKKGMVKPMKKAQTGKKIPAYDDDMNDRLMADTYAKYEMEKQAAERAKAKAKAKPAPKPLPKLTKTVGKPKAKNGGSFPDLNKDGKITKADILKGRGVIAKKGAKVKKK